jgi:hypothetical protein
LGSDGRKQTSDRFDVVIENLRLFSDDRLQGLFIPFQIRNEDFNRARIGEATNLTNSLPKYVRATIGQFIPVYRRDHDMTQPKGLHRLSDATRLVSIQRLGSTGCDSAIVTTACADVAEDQESGRPGIPTLPQIRTSALLTDRMEAEPVHGVTNVFVVRALPDLDLKPGRQAPSLIKRRVEILSGQMGRRPNVM